ncbi:MAG: TerC family protein [Elusimicrobia bacterium]|nr:TerC family protein [Elusimicrobiota bacterium]
MLAWTGFTLLILALLALDLGVFHRKAHAVGVREALGWSACWIALALGFNGWLWWTRGPQAGMEFLTGYLIEKSLSVDNIFVFLTLFAYFKVPAEFQHRVLFWGVLGALLMRGGMIAAGAALLERFAWIVYVFGGFLVVTGVQMARKTEGGPDPGRNPAVRLVRRLLPVADAYHGQRFLVRLDGALTATPLLLVVLVVEATDVVFAVDSIPAIFAVTSDPYIVWTSNVFAILGLRSLYFALAGVMDRFVYLKYGLAAVLVFVGAKMCASGVYHMPAWVSLAAIAALLGGSIAASFLDGRQPARAGWGGAA